MEVVLHSNFTRLSRSVARLARWASELPGVDAGLRAEAGRIESDVQVLVATCGVHAASEEQLQLCRSRQAAQGPSGGGAPGGDAGSGGAAAVFLRAEDVKPDLDLVRYKLLEVRSEVDFVKASLQQRDQTSGELSRKVAQLRDEFGNHATEVSRMAQASRATGQALQDLAARGEESHAAAVQALSHLRRQLGDWREDCSAALASHSAEFQGRLRALEQAQAQAAAGAAASFEERQDGRSVLADRCEELQGRLHALETVQAAQAQAAEGLSEWRARAERRLGELAASVDAACWKEPSGSCREEDSLRADVEALSQRQANCSSELHRMVRGLEQRANEQFEEAAAACLEVARCACSRADGLEDSLTKELHKCKERLDDYGKQAERQAKRQVESETEREAESLAERLAERHAHALRGELALAHRDLRAALEDPPPALVHRAAAAAAAAVGGRGEERRRELEVLQAGMEALRAEVSAVAALKQPQPMEGRMAALEGGALALQSQVAALRTCVECGGVKEAPAAAGQGRSGRGEPGLGAWAGPFGSQPQARRCQPPSPWLAAEMPRGTAPLGAEADTPEPESWFGVSSGPPTPKPTGGQELRCNPPARAALPANVPDAGLQGLERSARGGPWPSQATPPAPVPPAPTPPAAAPPRELWPDSPAYCTASSDADVSTRCSSAQRTLEGGQSPGGGLAASAVGGRASILAEHLAEHLGQASARHPRSRPQSAGCQPAVRNGPDGRKVLDDPGEGRAASPPRRAPSSPQPPARPRAGGRPRGGAACGGQPLERRPS